MLGSAATPALQAGQVKLLGWVGDETPWQEVSLWPRRACSPITAARFRHSCARCAKERMTITTPSPLPTESGGTVRERLTRSP